MDKKKLLAIIMGLVNTIAEGMEGGCTDKDNQQLAQGLVGRALRHGPAREATIAACATVPVATVAAE